MPQKILGQVIEQGHGIRARVRSEMRIAHRLPHVRVSKELPYLEEVHAAADKPACKRMPVTPRAE
jgi:hypothetical protein